MKRAWPLSIAVLSQKFFFKKTFRLSSSCPSNCSVCVSLRCADVHLDFWTFLNVSTWSFLLYLMFDRSSQVASVHVGSLQPGCRSLPRLLFRTVEYCSSLRWNFERQQCGIQREFAFLKSFKVALIRRTAYLFVLAVRAILGRCSRRLF